MQVEKRSRYRSGYRGKRVRWDRVAILVVGLLVVGFLLFKGITLLFTNPYKEYTVYNEENKAGLSVECMKDETDTQYISLFYPVMENEGFTQMIQEYMDGYAALNDREEMKEIHYMDFEVNNIQDHYMGITFHYQEFDEEKQLLQETYQTLTYDMKNEVVMTLDDVLRRNYEDMLKDDFTDLSNVEFRILESGLELFQTGDYVNKKTYPYKGNETYLRLNDPAINPNAPEEIVVPVKKSFDKEKKLIAFTFDDGPHYEITKQILDAFDEYNGSATFFMQGLNVERYPDIVREVYQRGFELGNHSYDHPMDLTRGDKNYLFEQIYGTNDLMFKVAGNDAKLFRPPFGLYNAFVEESLNPKISLWTVDTLDWQSRDANKIKDIVLSTVKPGDVILMHDLYPSTLQAVKELLPILHEQGYEFVSMSDLLALQNEQ